MPQSVTDNSQTVPADTKFIIAEICEDYFDRRERGESPSIEEYIQRFPSRGDEIRETLQALMLVNASSELSGAIANPGHVFPEVPGFTIRAEVGRGAVGVVYDALQVSDHSRVAIKVLKEQGRFNLNIQERFLREAAVSTRLQHPHIVRCLGSGRAGDDAYLAMEFIPGHNFHDVFECLLQSESENSENESRPVDRFLQKSAEELADYRKLASFGADIASALSYAHKQRVIHRDIKPANLIVDLNGKPWIADFGLAKIHYDDDCLSRTGDMVGTPRYMAPEQLRGVCSTHSDIYALGVTLYEFAARQRAWQSVARNQLFTARASMELPNLAEVNPEVPPGLAKIITKACAFDPVNRYESTEELETVLRRFADGKSNADRRNRARLEEDTFVRRKPVLWTVGVIAGLTAAAVLLTTGGQQQHTAVAAEDVISMLSNDQSLERAIEALPETPDDDSLGKVVERHVAAKQVEGLIDRGMKQYGADKKDIALIKDEANNMLDEYRTGGVTRGQAKEIVGSLGVTFTMMRFGLAMKKIEASDWPQATKRFSLAVCNEMMDAINGDTMSDKTVSSLKNLIPGSKVKGKHLDAALKSLVKQSWDALNALPQMPPGSPYSAQRKEYLKANRGRKL